MSSNLPVQANKKTEIAAVESSDFVTMTIAEQLFGIPVLQVQDVLGPMKITRIPLAPPEVAGSLNLRGRIVTSIDIRVRMGLPPREDGKHSMSVVVEHRGELYSLVVDHVGEVMSLPNTDHEPVLPTMDPSWREVASGLYRLSSGLLVVIDVNRLLSFASEEAA